ncbi:malonate decarboxylase holo-[acyl-carrier-protein] synthase [Afifella sp. H1R]|uniref:malonate decarboxylase holo-[acyl-carrier-protein] synthase n=1 Tax=Afifella sp. H1R TaxID=2908841 RepID=UPI002102764C|nr:malonate decarboxylase holo-[acyl-carrier-protein] synthase [Afifella sp. H1R]
MLNRRHFLAYLHPDARQVLAPAIVEGLPHTMRDHTTEAAVLHGFLTDRIPGIVCRPTRACTDEQGQLGFSFPLRIGEERVRSSVLVEPEQVASFLSPYEVMERAALRFPPPHAALRVALSLARRFEIRLGLIGSAALAAMTGLPYVRPQSDLDLLIDADHGGDFQAFHASLAAISREIGVKVDVELEFNRSIGVKISEYISGREVLLAKTINDVELIDRIELQSCSSDEVNISASVAGRSGENCKVPATETIENQWSE